MAPPDSTVNAIPIGNVMKLGHSERYDTQLREKASVHNPPTPPQYMGFEGEYDTTGLAKRIAKQLDEAAQVAEVATLQIVQRDAVISFEGAVPNQALLNRILDIAAQVDGIQAIDVSKVAIASEL